MARIKVTGYINVEDLETHEVDLTDPTGLSAEGYDNVRLGNDERPAYSLSSLEDVEIELEED